MINVTLDTNIGRTLLTMTIAAMKYKEVVEKKALQNLETTFKNIENIRETKELFTELSTDTTARLLDKRFNVSKDFIKSGGTKGALKFKKSTTQEDKNLQYITQKNALKARTRYNSAVSNYNQKLTDIKIKTSYKLIEV